MKYFGIFYTDQRMKYILPVVLFLFFQTAYGQDRLILFAGDTMKVKVVKITDNEIKYRLTGDTSGPVRSIAKSKVHRIHYANNTTLTFWAPPEEMAILDSTAAGPDPHEMFMRGMQDASTHYKRYKGTFAGCFAGGFTLNILSFIPPLICATHKIPDRALNYPDARLMKNEDYRRGYTGEAKHRKVRAAWTGWAIGFGSSIVVGVITGIVYSNYAIHH